MYKGRAGRSKSPANARARSRSRSVARGGMRTHDEHGNMIDDGPISNFVTSIDSLPADEWRARTLAFESLIESLPRPNEPPVFIGNGITPWYKSHTAMRRLFKPLSELLLDARSTVAKHTCQHLAFLVRRVNALNPPKTDICKYLMKDLLPTVLALHAQTVKVIRGYAAEMMNIIIPLCRFKSGLPVMLERLRKDKSRDVREACVKYLRLVVRHWARDIPTSLDNNDEIGTDQAKQEYLTPSICLHIGNGLARALMDPSDTVRMEARNAFEIFRFKYPDIWNQIVQKRDGILSKDKRLKKSIINAAMKADSEGRSDLSNYYPTYDEGEDYDGKSIHSSGSRGSWHSKESFTSKTTGVHSRRSASRPRSRQPTGLNGPPKRTTSANGKSGKSLPPQSRNGKISAPQSGYSRQISSTKQGSYGSSVTERSPRTSTEKKTTTNEEPIATNGSISPPNIGDEDIKDPVPTLSSEDLAADMRNNNNITYGTELTQSTSSVSDQSSPNNGVPRPNENYQVANQLLSAHKTYIDELMESLRTEMNTVREFEALLVQSMKSTSPDGSFGPSEDEVLKYFETVYGFLEKGTENGTKLREAMETISRTEFQ